MSNSRSLPVSARAGAAGAGVTRPFATASLVPHSGFLFLHPAGPALPPASPFHLHRFPFRQLGTLCNNAGQLGFLYENHLLADGRRRPHPHLMPGPLQDNGVHEELLYELAIPGAAL